MLRTLANRERAHVGIALVVISFSPEVGRAENGVSFKLAITVYI